MRSRLHCILHAVLVDRLVKGYLGKKVFKGVLTYSQSVPETRFVAQSLNVFDQVCQGLE